MNHSNNVPYNFLDKTNSHFRYLHCTQDTVCSNLHAEGVGAQKKYAAVISTEDEELFWEKKKIKSFENPQFL